jgi:peptidoglycan/xylan/chitin deacetylase (PgdA/CDA1 family)
MLEGAADALLRMAHACPRHPNGAAEMSVEDLEASCTARQIAFLETGDIHSEATLAFVRSQRPDLGVVYGTRILKPALFTIPRHGSINIHQRKVPDYRGGGPIGLWELLAGEREIGVTVHQVEEQVDAGAILVAETIPIEDFDSLSSLAIKAHVIGNDLLVHCIRQFAMGAVTPRPQGAGGKVFRTPTPQRLLQYRRELRRRRPGRPNAPERPGLKLLARSVFLAPYAIGRNWVRRARGSFPVVILYHHLVTDRSHRDGITTDGYMAHVRYLRKHYRIASLTEAIDMLEAGRVDMPTVVLTLDDGYQDNFLGLRGVVEESGAPIALFVSTGQVRERREFAHDVSANLHGFLPLTSSQVAYMSERGFEIGSHTRSHFDCGSVDEAALRAEIVESKADLDAWLQKPTRFFAFPWGQPANMSRAAVRLASGTYRCVLSAFGGTNSPTGQGRLWHLRRCPHPNNLWELELQVQSLLELADPHVVLDPAPQHQPDTTAVTSA